MTMIEKTSVLAQDSRLSASLRLKRMVTLRIGTLWRMKMSRILSTKISNLSTGMKYSRIASVLLMLVAKPLDIRSALVS